MAKIKLGKIAISWKGPYDASATTYHAQDVVSYNGQCYICLTDNLAIGTVPTDNNHWDVFLESPISQVTTEHDLVRRNHEGTIERLPLGEEDTVLGIDYVTKTPTWQKMQFTKSTRVKKFTNDLGHDSLQLSCFVIDENDRLRGWGSNENFHLGIGTSDDDEMLPTHVAFPRGFCGVNKAYVSAKSYMGCIDNDGKWWAWGKDGANEGSPGNNLAGQTLFVPVCISDDPSESIYGKTIIESVHHYGEDTHYSNILLASDGTVHFVGYDSGGNKLSGTSAGSDAAYYQQIVSPYLSNIVSITATGENRYSTYYALNNAGKVFAWGANSQKQISTSGSSEEVMDITPSGITIKKIIGAPYRAFAIDINDAIYSWGYNDDGQLGIGSFSSREFINSPMQFSDGTTYVDGNTPDKKVKILFFNTHRNFQITGIVTQDNKVYTCGENTSNHSTLQAGTTNTNQLTEIPSLSGRDIIKVACVGGEDSGSTTTMFLTSDHEVWVGGFGGQGQLGNGKSNSVVIEEMKLFNSSLKIVDIHGYGYDENSGFCLLNEDGRLFYCGSGAGMKSGDNDSLNKHIIQEILF